MCRGASIKRVITLAIAAGVPEWSKGEGSRSSA